MSRHRNKSIESIPRGPAIRPSMVALALLIAVMTLSSCIFIASEGASAPPTKSIETSYAEEHPP